MADDRKASEAERRLAELRRRLYRPGAEPGDLQRYLAEAAEAPRTERAEHPADVPAPRRRRGPLLLGAGAVAIAVAAAVVLALPRAPGAPAASPAALDADASAGPGDGQVLTPYGAIVPVPTPVAASVDGEAAAAQLYRGRGDSRIPLDFQTAPSAGRLAVTLVSDDPARVSWIVVRVDPASTPPYRTIGRSDPGSRTGTAPVTRTLPYRGGPPMLLEVTADADVRWHAVVAFLPRTPPELR